MAIVQKSTEARATGDLPLCPVVIRRTSVPDELATDALVKPLGHGGLDEFLDQVVWMSLAENNKVIQALVLDAFNKSFRVGIAIWALRWEFHALHAPCFEHRDERLREQRAPIVDQVLCFSQKSIHRICQIAGHLLHPLLAWVNSNPRNLDGAALEFDDEEHHVPNRAKCAQGFHAKEIAGA
jgi:hypothetical protein